MKYLVVMLDSNIEMDHFHFLPVFKNGPFLVTNHTYISIAHRLSVSPSQYLDMTEILFIRALTRSNQSILKAYLIIALQKK